MHDDYILIAFALTFVLLVLCILGSILWVNYNKTRNEALKPLDDTQKTIVQILGGVGLVLTFYAALDKDSATLRNTEKQIIISGDQVNSTQFSSSSVMLGNSESKAVRSAGVYSLYSLAQSQRGDYKQRVINILHAFVLDSPERKMYSENFHRVDIQAAIDVLADIRGRKILHFYRTNLIGLQFNDTDFSDSFFISANLYGSNFTSAKLVNAKFSGANISDWAGWQKKFGNTPSAEQYKSYQWNDWEKYDYIANFTGANLTGADFSGAGLAGAKFDHAILTNTNFTGADLSRSTFIGAVNIRQAIFAQGTRKACSHPDWKPDFGQFKVELEMPCSTPKS